MIQIKVVLKLDEYNERAIKQRICIHVAKLCKTLPDFSEQSRRDVVGFY